jgi:hypothetical protein
MRYLLALLLLLPMCSIAQTQTVRRILLFAPDSNSVELKTQREWLRADAAGVTDRDIYLAVFNLPQKQAAIFKNYQASPAGFTLILFGKDGTVKLRSNKPVPARDLFDLIDAMPMRQAELRQRQKGTNPHQN